MVAPTVMLLSLDALSRVPAALRDASAALGASPWQTAFRVSAPYAWRGLLVAVFFGFARAAGETMAVQLVIGGARRLPKGSFLFAPTTTISAQIVMDMQETRPGTPCRTTSSYSMALVLLLVSVAVVLGTRSPRKVGAQVSAAQPIPPPLAAKRKLDGDRRSRSLLGIAASAIAVGYAGTLLYLVGRGASEDRLHRPLSDAPRGHRPTRR